MALFSGTAQFRRHKLSHNTPYLRTVALPLHSVLLSLNLGDPCPRELVIGLQRINAVDHYNPLTFISASPHDCAAVGDLDVFGIRSLVHMIEIYFNCVSLILIFFKYSGSVTEGPSGKVLSPELKILKNTNVIHVYF